MERRIGHYNQFRCTADQCQFTCCQEWRIGVDDETFKKWEALSLEEQPIIGQVLEDEGGYRIRLNAKKQCPFLNSDKLCKLVMTFGESCLSETCTLFPRQINHFQHQTEYALDLGCPAVIDRLQQDNQKVAYVEGAEADQVLMIMRDQMAQWLQDETYSLSEVLMMAFFILLEVADLETFSIEDFKERTKEKQLQRVVRTIRKMRFNELDTLLEGNELFLDIVENYRKEKLYKTYIEPLARQAEILESSYEDEILVEKKAAFKGQLQPYEGLIRKYMAMEMLANSLKPDMNLEDFILSFQWMALEYGTLIQSLFLRWMVDKEVDLSYEVIRDYMVVVARVTGYAPSDVREYLENSFQEVIWEWGYLALIVGK